jgi:hypothetical protein
MASMAAANTLYQPQNKTAQQAIFVYLLGLFFSPIVDLFLLVILQVWGCG